MKLASAKRRQYAKLFFDPDTAKQFGEEIELIAHKILVPAGEAGKLYYIFQNSGDTQERVHKEGRPTEPFYHIEKGKGSGGQDIYYVRYGIVTSPGASKADMVQAERQAKEYLDQKYKELCPSIGISR